MGGDVMKDVSSIALAIVGLATLAVLVSRNANTTGVLNSGSSAFNTALATAAGPVTGYSPGAPIYASSSTYSMAESNAGYSNSIH
jgi:hypothetical protein